MQVLYPLIIESAGLILISPTHHYNITAWMKAFIDRMYCFYTFEDTQPRKWASRLAGQGRKAVVGAVCEQENPDDMGFTIEAMKRPLQALGYEIIGELPVFGIFDKGKVRRNQAVLSNSEQLGAKLAQALKFLN